MSTATAIAEDNKAFVRRFIEEYWNQGSISISRIANGKFVEEVVTTDLLSLMKQLGVIPRIELIPNP